MVSANKYMTKGVSGTLLVLLLCVHSIKLLHTHSGRSLSSHDEQKKNHSIKNGVDCSICDYQLTKDSDASVSFCGIQLCERGINASAQFISSHKKPFYTAFETRGPPAA